MTVYLSSSQDALSEVVERIKAMKELIVKLDHEMWRSDELLSQMPKSEEQGGRQYREDPRDLRDGNHRLH